MTDDDDDDLIHDPSYGDAPDEVWSFDGYTYVYRVCPPPPDLPKGLRFDASGQFQGQVVLRQWGAFGPGGGDVGDPYMRVKDQSYMRSWRYYHLIKTIADNGESES